MRTKIFVCCHKECNPKSSNVYTPIQVGKSISQKDLGYLGDDTGDNISGKNSAYSEMTAMYWMWKNFSSQEKNVDYVGIAHYRRYLKVDESDIPSYFDKFDILLGKPWIHSFSNVREFTYWEPYEYLLLLIDEILKCHPEYKDSIIDYFFHSNKWYRCNVFVMRSSDYNKYCEWLFPILFEVEKKIDKTQFSRINRIMGYLGEIMLGLYVEHTKMKKCLFDFEMTESKEPKLAMFVHDTLANIAFFITEGARIFYSKHFGNKNEDLILPAFIGGLNHDGYELKYLKSAFSNS